MKIYTVLGSRNPEGQTAAAAHALLKGAEERGAAVEEVYLPDAAIESCRQCDLDGWGQCRREGRCIIEDDMPKIMDKMGRADAVVFANPVYFGDLSESMKRLLDRTRRVARHSDQNPLAGIPALGICVAGGGGGGSFQCMANLEKVLTTCGFDLVDQISVRRQNQRLKLDILRTTGQYLADGTIVS